MKLAIMGGGGIRAPLFVESLLKRQASGGPITRLVLQDIQEKRLEVIRPMVLHLRDMAASPLEIETTTNLDHALDGADYVVTTIRAGFEQGRVLDEKIPLDIGCIGQETVGPGGFAMSMRSIPALVDAAERLARLSPRAWIINFTNPAGIVTQALHDFGFDNVVGICDSANTIARDAATVFKAPLSTVRLKVFGLNHCSFAGDVNIEGEAVLDKLLADDDYLERYLGLYEKDRLRDFHALPNEYLYYYFYPEKAFEAMKAEERTRGELIVDMHHRFFTGAWRNGVLLPIEELFRFHQRILHERHETYMDYAWKETDEGRRPDDKMTTDGEGYAGIALDFIQARASKEKKLIVLNYRNAGALPFFADSDIAELSFSVNADAVTPSPPETKVHPSIRTLLTEVKTYENLACASAMMKSRRVALAALRMNPLVRSEDKAEKLLFRFAAAHGGLLKEIAEG